MRSELTMLLILSLSVLFTCSVDGITVRNRTFAVHTEFSDVLYGDGLISSSTLTSLTLCGVYCGIKNCLSFSYSNVTGVCRMYSISFPLCDPSTPTSNKNSGTSLPFYRELDYKVRFCPCNLDLNDGTWTVIHQRFDGSVSFLRNWLDYKNGFGDPPNGEFWLGLEQVYQLVKNKEFVLMVDLVDKTDVRKCSLFRKFSIASEADKYRLSADGYIGNGGDSFSYHNTMKFSTTDSDNDNRTSGSCVAAFSGPGWLNDCLSQNLNGLYSVATGASSMCYRAFKNFEGLKKAKMLIKEKANVM